MLKVDLFNPSVYCLHPHHDFNCHCGHGDLNGIIRPQHCAKCDGLTLSLLEFYDGVEPETATSTTFVCSSCQGPAIAEAGRLREMFEGLLNDGLNRVEANTIMCRYVDNMFDGNTKTT